MIIWFFSSNSTKLYDDFRSRNFSIELMTLFKNVFVQLMAAIIILYLMNEIYLSKTFSFVYAFVLFGFVASQKIILRKILYSFRKKGRNLRNLLIVGAGDVGKKFYDILKLNSQFGYNIVGFVDDEKKPFLNGQYLGAVLELEKVLNSKPVDLVVVALPNYAEEKIEQVTRLCDRYTKKVIIIPDYMRFVSDRYKISMFGRFPVINVREDRLNEVQWRIAKRAFDIAFSLFVILAVFTWLLPLVAVLIKISSTGPVFFKQERWGKNNRKFRAFKFRSMVVQSKDVNYKDGFQQATKNDPRVTKIGKILRKTNLDEIPQFLNVLMGDMTVVGPRPHPTPLNMESKEKIDLYMVRHFVKPGLTGWAQVNGYRGETKDDEVKMQKRVGYDLWYIENWSFWLDIQIIFLTIWRTIVGDPNAY
jgi:Undecaprenyl-phosphate glucose phosphotransferase